MKWLFGFSFIFLTIASALTEDLHTPEFASYLYSAIAKETAGSFVFSPVATETLLACLAEGSRGQTKTQLMGVLPPFTSLSAQRISFRMALEKLDFLSNNLLLTDTTTMVLRNDLKLNKEYEEIATSMYGVKMSFVDFRDKVALFKLINSYSQSDFSLPTFDRIGHHSNIFLVNSLSLNATFAETFFRNTIGIQNNRLKKIVTLVKTGNFKYFDNTALDARFLEIPFKFPNTQSNSSPLKMVIVLPNQFGGLTTLEEQGDLIFRRQPYHNARVRVTLPEIFTESELDFKQILQYLGVTDVFDADKADLSRMSFYNQRRYFVSQFKQTVKLNVNRKHADAKSEGGFELNTRMGGVLSFDADRPFLYYIHLDGLILFAGRFITTENI